MTAKNFEEFWISLTIPFKVFGLVPQILQPKNPKKANFLLIYNLVVAIIVCVIVLGIYLKKRNFLDETINVIVDYILLYAFLFTHLFVLFESNVTICSQKLIYTKLMCLADSFHKKLNFKVDFHALQIKCLKKIWITSMLCFSIIFIAGSTLDDFWIFFGSCVFSVIVTRIRFIQISVYVDILTEYFHSLGIVLQKLRSNLNADDKFEILLVVKDVYGNLVDVNSLIENAFGWSMAAIVAQNFVDMLNQGYWTFVNIYSIKSVTFGINIISFILGFSIPLLHLVYSFRQCNKQSSKIAFLLHALSYTEQFNFRESELIQAISLNMLQQSIRVKIVGIFTINYDLLAKMAGSIATFLTIILQFQLREMNFT